MRQHNGKNTTSNNNQVQWIRLGKQRWLGSPGLVLNAADYLQPALGAMSIKPKETELLKQLGLSGGIRLSPSVSIMVEIMQSELRRFVIMQFIVICVAMGQGITILGRQIT